MLVFILVIWSRKTTALHKKGQRKYKYMFSVIFFLNCQSFKKKQAMMKYRGMLLLSYVSCILPFVDR